MASPDSLILSYLSWWPPLGYALIFLGMVVEGEGFLFAASFLTHQGFFNPFLIFAVAFAGAIIGDYLWYCLGQVSWRLIAPLRWWAERLAKPFDDHVLARPLKTILVSKFTYGFHHVILMRAGARRLPLGVLLKSDLTATFSWILLIGSLGYLFGAAYLLARRYLQFVELALFLGLAIFFLAQYLASRVLKKKL